MAERSRFPAYDTLAKRNTPSWNNATRTVIATRLSDQHTRRFFDQTEWDILLAICQRIIPQRSPDKVPIACFIDARLTNNIGDGFRRAGQPGMREMWRRGLHALDAEARQRFGQPFTDLSGGRQDDLLSMIQHGDVCSPAWRAVAPETFFKSRMVHDIVMAYCSHPTSWNDMGFGGPASPRGYVRMGFNRRDPWDPVERKNARHRS
jgi:Gluconate 2-dehydrogenase subunit 3